MAVAMPALLSLVNNAANLEHTSLRYIREAKVHQTDGLVQGIRIILFLVGTFDVSQTLLFYVRYENEAYY